MYSIGYVILHLIRSRLLPTTMYAIKALQSLTSGRQEDPICKTLRALDVPLTTADCRACIDPCDLGECHVI